MILGVRSTIRKIVRIDVSLVRILRCVMVMGMRIVSVWPILQISLDKIGSR